MKQKMMGSLGVSVASSGPYASYFQFAADILPWQHAISQCPANTQCESTEDMSREISYKYCNHKVTRHLENLEKSGNSRMVREKSGKIEKVREKSGQLKFES